MPEVSAITPSSTEPTISVPEKPKRNWKKILLILLILGVSVSLVGVGIYFYGSSDKNLPFKQVETKEPSETPKEHPLKNKIIYTKTIVIDTKKTPERIITNYDTDVYSMNFDGTGETKIHDFELNETASLRLSPKNTYLSWLKDDLIHFKKLIISKQNQIETIGPIDNAVTYKFSPDESKVAVIVDRNPNRSSSDEPSFEIQIFNIQDNKKLYEYNSISDKDGKNVDINNASVAWLSNNTLILQMKNGTEEYIASFSIKNNLELDRIIASGDEFMGSFWLDQSLDKITYTKFKEDSTIQIWISGIDGSNTKKVSEFSGYYVNSLAFSPDDKKIALTANNAEATFFQVINLGTGKIVEGNNKAYFTPIWLSNSESFLVNNGIYVQNISTVGLNGKVMRDLTKATIESVTEPKAGAISNYRVIGVIQ